MSSAEDQLDGLVDPLTAEEIDQFLEGWRDVGSGAMSLAPGLSETPSLRGRNLEALPLHTTAHGGGGGGDAVVERECAAALVLTQESSSFSGMGPMYGSTDDMVVAGDCSRIPNHPQAPTPPLPIVDVPAKADRTRSPDWTAEQRQLVLELREAALSKPELKGKALWDYISEGLGRRGFERSARHCSHQWGTLLKAYKMIQRNESLGLQDPRTSRWKSYWHMTEADRSKLKFVTWMTQEWFDTMQTILVAEGIRRSGMKTPGRVALPHRMIPTQDPAAEAKSGAKRTGKRRRAAVTQARKDDRRRARETPCIRAQQVQDAVEAACSEGVASSALATALTSVLTPIITQTLQDALGPILRPGAGPLREPFEAMIKDAVSAKLQPMSSVLQAHRRTASEEDRQRLRVISAKQRALDREKQVIAKRHGRTRRAFQMSSANKVVPAAFQGLNIATSGDRDSWDTSLNSEDTTSSSCSSSGASL